MGEVQILERFEPSVESADQRRDRLDPEKEDVVREWDVGWHDCDRCASADFRYGRVCTDTFDGGGHWRNTVAMAWSLDLEQ